MSKPKCYTLSWVLLLGALLHAFAPPAASQSLARKAQRVASTANSNSISRGLPAFGVLTLAPAFELNGVGRDVDSLAFWEAPEPTNTLLLVTAKSNDLLEVWKYPFQGHEQPPKQFTHHINGVAVDQTADLLYVSDRQVTVLSLPSLQYVAEFGLGTIGVGENNLDLLRHTTGQTFIYVSEDHKVHRFAAQTWDYLGSFAPPVKSIETLLADDYYQIILVPEEQGIEGRPGVYAYTPEGTPFLKNGTNRFGNHGEFNSDEEGILLYTFPTHGKVDNGTGFYVVTDQRSDHTDFEFFDRQTWSYLGTLRIEGVSNTDGIASTQIAMPDYPLGLFTAINNDTTTVGLGWHVIFKAMGLSAYRLWTLDQGLEARVNDGYGDDPDDDGWTNLEEFALDGAPLTGASHDKQLLSLENMDGTNCFTYTFPVRLGAIFVGTGELTALVDGILYAVAGSVNLVTFSQSVEEGVALQPDLPVPNPGWSYRTFSFRQSLANPNQGFICLRIETAP